MPIDHVNALPPGTRFEEYRLDAVLGAGGFGITYRAYDANLDKFVAIKEYLPGEFVTRAERYTVVPQSSTDAQDYHWGLNRFLDEARTLARFDHPHLNKVYRFFESNGTAYMVLEYIQGETLADRLTRERQLSEEALQRLLDEVLSGLAVMHDAGYVHRDIKPGNLMLREEGGSAVVLDFGAARQAVGRRSQRLTTILTPGYAPIEQYDSQADDVGPWSDIYALGMVAYRCISGLGDGDLPDAVTRGRTQRKEQIDLTPATEAGKGQYSAKLLEAIDWAIQVDERDRPQTVTEWQAALAGGKTKKRTGKPVRKPATRTAETTGERTGIGWAGAVLLMVAGVLIGAGAWWAWQQYPEVFGQGPGDTPAVAERAAPTNIPGDIPQESATGETGNAGEMAAGTEDAPLPDPATASTESAGSEVEPRATEPAKTAPAEEDEITWLLAAAEADLKARRLTSPAGNNAWEKYQQVLGLSPAHPEAMAGMERVIGSYMELFGAAVEQEDFDKAAGYLTRIRELHPDSPVLETGEERLAQARQAREERLAKQERRRQAEEAARQAELETQRIARATEGHWEDFETAIQAEDLDEAATILAQVWELNPEESGLAAGEQRLAALQTELERKRQAAEENLQQLAGDMANIPGGSFRMGDISRDGLDSEKPVHSVTVPAFRLGKHEVTVGQFRRFVKATGYRTDAERNANGNAGCRTYTGDGWDWTSGRSWRNPGFSVGDDHPVVCVSWNDAEAFVEWLSTETGKSFRLPTESEWEYAARAGSSTKYHFGNSESQLCRYGNHADISTDFDWRNETCWDGVGKRTAEVGRYQPNSYGLYDMHGNVWEWVEDCWNDSYVGAPGDGRAWTSGDCSRHVIRGGSWSNEPWFLDSAFRDWYVRSNRNFHIGFRLAQDK